ncbi:PREDICTED: calcium-binding and coiled-coil domain-containing protein 2 [Gekko japonicus]|uniref:Calcium-binding and coiled-coil domain-containing protein 2 n=1 Tax=Gekko japonicus TaxID=146911 RepID=A0ABM1JTB4_GEKJA|nr:PREDICTED: calcium-binding and coiled-coil domain-containing protein 2 [Gekko japonicus]
MEGTLDDPPTSTVVLDSYHFSQVIFTNVEKFYIPGADVTCHYNLSEHITPRRKDWVGIFKVGWKTTREYYTFMWAPLPSSPDSAEHQEVLFKAYYLPKDDEYYQFCYVDQDGIVRGASVPFQFHVASEDDMLVVTTQGEVEEIEQQNKSLLQENQKLKETLTNLQKQNEDLQEQIVKAQLILISNIKIKEETKKLWTEKEKLEYKLKATLGCVDQLQSQVQKEQQEVEKYQKADGDKAGLLEQLKEENKQLQATLLVKEQEEIKLRELFQTVKKNTDKVKTMTKVLQQESEVLMAHRQEFLEDAPAGSLTRSSENATLVFGNPYSAPAAQEHAVVSRSATQYKFQVLQQESEVLMAHRQEFLEDAPAGSLTRSSENATLVFGNPYSGTLERPDRDLVSLKQCPICSEAFLPGFEEQYSVHVQSHILDCPYCEETFDASNQQVYDDHVYCHGLD